ncbi:alpha-amylase family glycosyl hydrolase [Segetibacter sp. 3557_3]|uniref:alpha-amylase family glycosyl hydrolase n=1 Tax=Segetibacter sp. 3557_3 TaxID=2547429 RepID=UPI001404C759|nr:alpha-amylase family glycosyl hydrolase [Segetibacter sp. 3557_3]
MKRCLYWLLGIIIITTSACQNTTTTGEQGTAAHPTGDSGLKHPEWILQGNIYEVNVRQYTTEGTFKAFQANLDRLKEMGVQTLWFMPINPISIKDRKGTLGSYYAVSNYTQVNPEFGDMNDWKALVKAAHDKGFKVIIDWVANHTGADHVWLTSHPDFYVKDSSGNAKIAFDWSDTRQLDHSNTAMGDSMIEAMRYWITESDIDGFRCDVAGTVPTTFWKRCIGSLQKQKPLFMLAEGDTVALHHAGFNATYPWNMFQMMKKIAKGERPAFAIDSIRMQTDSIYPADAIRMYFTSNHDENSWNGADYETMPGAVHAPFAVYTQTAGRSVPLIYSGQEEPVLRKVEFFERDPLRMGKFKRAQFYKTLLSLRARNPALAANSKFSKVVVGNERALYAFVREHGTNRVLVILNLSASEQTITVKDKGLYATPMNLFLGNKEPVSDKPFNIEPWGYIIYEY